MVEKKLRAPAVALRYLPRMRDAARGRVLRVAVSSEGDRVTTLELLFDLVFVFAFTQVTSLMGHDEPPRSLLEGFIVLSLLWWSWCSFAWLANQARADQGNLPAAFVVVMAAMFVACLAIPDAFHDTAHDAAAEAGHGGGGLPAAATLVGCYAVVRLTHVGFYLLAARGNAALRRQLVLTLLTSITPTIALLAVGAAVDDRERLWIWLVAVLYDMCAIFIGARGGGGWALPSAEHFAERHGLVVILALGESIVAIGAGVGEGPLHPRAVAGAVLALGLAVGVWWLYFTRRPDVLVEALRGCEGAERAALARDLFTYLHLPIVAGIILGALGVEEAMAHLYDERLGALGGWALAGGLALTVTGSTLALRRATGEWPVVRAVGGVVLLLLGALLWALPALLALALTTAVLVGLCAGEARGPRAPVGRAAAE